MSLPNGRRADSLPAPYERSILNGTSGLSLNVPPELIEAISERTAALLAELLPASPEPYLDVDGAAGYLACSRDRIYDLRRQGLAHFKDGSRLLFKREDLDGWLSRVETAENPVRLDKLKAGSLTNSRTRSEAGKS
jgi:excisionase family DNA binding protein